MTIEMSVAPIADLERDPGAVEEAQEEVSAESVRAAEWKEHALPSTSTPVCQGPAGTSVSWSAPRSGKSRSGRARATWQRAARLRRLQQRGG